MTKVHIEEKFNTSLGTIISVANNEKFKVGDRVCDDEGSVYTIVKIQMPTTPQKADTVCLIVN